MKLYRIAVLVVFASLYLPGLAFSGESIDPISSGSITENLNQYSLTEFNSLSDAEKKEVYYNSPQRLPDNFDSSEYVEILQNNGNSEQ